VYTCDDKPVDDRVIETDVYANMTQMYPINTMLF
jgi:hypothetical protein